MISDFRPVMSLVPKDSVADISSPSSWACRCDGQTDHLVVMRFKIPEKLARR
jgi:hypothetical protein